MATGGARKRQSFFRANLRKLLLGVAVLGVGGAIAAKRLSPLPVTATPVVRGKAVDAVYATGTVEADDRVNLKAKSSGSVAAILVKEGQPVKKGDLLARIDNPVVTFDLKRGQADLSAATAQAGSNAPQLAALRAQADAIKADLATARTELGRTEALVKGGSVAQAELDRAAARVTQLEGQLGANEAQQRALRIDLDANAQRQAAAVQSLASRVSDTEVRAPLDGVVLSKSVEIGEVVAINQTLFKVGDTRHLILEVSVDEADVARVHDGTAGNPPSLAAVSLYAFPKEVFRGKVFDVLPDANRDRKAFLVKVRLDAPPPGLRSGMSAEVNIIAREEPSVLLAASEAEADGAVWLVRGGRARRQKIQIGIRDLLRVQVIAGLEEGDLVVVEGQDKLQDGVRVAATVRPADKAEPMPDQTQPGQAARK
jgi:multidrug efflux pump subunit AcrA (membrane-fusion protein)